MATKVVVNFVDDDAFMFERRKQIQSWYGCAEPFRGLRAEIEMKPKNQGSQNYLTLSGTEPFNPHTQRWPYLANVTCEPSI